MNVKYQVFVSSTYDDLRAERDQVIKAVLEMGHIPVGMEMFSAADEEQWKIIARQIDESDYYVVITAQRYGSVVEGISYTEKEYDYAVLKGVPVIGFIIDSAAPWPADRGDIDVTKVAALQAFKEKLRKKPIGTWSSASDLYGKFSIALMKLTTANPRPGWVRASDIPAPEVMAELTRLSAENARLRADAAAVKAQRDQNSAESSMLRTLRNIKVAVSIFYEGVSDWTAVDETTLYRVFYILAPELMTEKSASSAAYLLALMFAKSKPIRKQWPLPSNTMNSWLADLMSFGLVEPSSKQHAVSDKDNYWTLSERGRQTFAEQRRSLLEQRANEEIERRLAARAAAEKQGTASSAVEASSAPEPREAEDTASVSAKSRKAKSRRKRSG